MLFASAFLSELLTEQKIKMTHMRVGSSPVYYIPGQEEGLEKYSTYLKSKEKEAYDFFKRCQDDKLLGEEIKSILASGEREVALVRIAAREGFHTTIEELKTIAEKALQ
jgi:hypothetical protein